MALYHKYRPKTFEKVIGNVEVVSAIKNMVEDKQKCPHSFLLHGPTGTGKTTISRIIADMLGCHENDFRELDAADFRGIDSIREIRKQAQFKPMSGNVRVWILDECHKLTNDAQNALLKIVEDTPEHVYFIFCTTEPQKLISTLKARCSQFQLKTLNDKQMHMLLRRTVKEENESLEAPIYEQIIQDSLGHPRNGLQILDQVLRVPSELRLETAKKSAEEQSQSIELCRALLARKGWKEVNTILAGLTDQEPESIRRHILGYCQSVLLKSDNSQAALIIEQFWEPLYNTGFPGLVFCCYSIIKT